ncbi:hypothetical protein [Polluticoccus soli]|uniref:hypothetical protein n=1 Tax=Polluticoccus soli TaxID=3034150 RepID=UPI0023E16D42|nr:hypothetical protein [Flavipsychrobacter sp. JY13-12]
MFIKNQKFSDEDMLMETLFDFGLGDASPLMQEVIQDVSRMIESDLELSNHLRTLDEEDAMELLTDIQLEQQAKKLREQFTSFAVSKAKLYGITADGEEKLLYEIDLV